MFYFCYLVVLVLVLCFIVVLEVMIGWFLSWFRVCISGKFLVELNFGSGLGGLVCLVYLVLSLVWVFLWVLRCVVLFLGLLVRCFLRLVLCMCSVVKMLFLGVLFSMMLGMMFLVWMEWLFGV